MRISLLKCPFALCLFLTCLSTASAASPGYLSRKDIATGFTNLRGLAIADFNGDGKPDLAVTDTSAKNVYVYLNDGTGKFGTPIASAVNIGSTIGLGVLVAGDVNEDGKQDLIASSVAGLQPTYVLLGNGDGRFTQAALVPGSFTAGSLVDVNGDSHLDLVSVFLTAKGPSLALGDGKGNFTSVALAAPAIAQGQPGFFTAIVTGDFDRDGRIDLLAALSTDQAGATRGLYFYANAGNNTFLAPRTIANTTTDYSHGTLAAADFDSDGKLDLLDGSAVIAYIFPGYGDGTFGLGVTAHGPYFLTSSKVDGFVTVATADLNADTFADIIVAVPTDNVLYAFLNEGKGDFYQNTPDFSATLAGRPGTLLTADLNGDGLPDLVVTDITNQNVSYFLSIKPKATPTVAVSAAPAQVLAGSSVTVSVSITGGATKPTGTVTLSDGSQALGQAQLDSNGTTSFNLPSLTTGAHSFVATYAGDSNYVPASNAAVLSVAVTDVTVTVPSSSQTIAAGGTATYSVALTPVANFSGTVAFTCSGLPVGYSCRSTPVTLSGQPTTATVQVVAGSASNAMPVLPFRRGRGALGVMLAGLLFVYLLPAARRLHGTLVCVLLLGALTSLVTGCSSSGTQSGASTTPVYRGSTTFTITAALTQGAVTITHSSQATLIVQ